MYFIRIWPIILIIIVIIMFRGCSGCGMEIETIDTTRKAPAPRLDLELVDEVGKDVAQFKKYLVLAHENGCLDDESYVDVKYDCDIVINEASLLVEYWQQNTRIANELRQVAVIKLSQEILEQYKTFRYNRGCKDDKLRWAAGLLEEDVKNISFKTRFVID